MPPRLRLAPVGLPTLLAALALAAIPACGSRASLELGAGAGSDGAGGGAPAGSGTGSGAQGSGGATTGSAVGVGVGSGPGSGPGATGSGPGATGSATTGSGTSGTGSSGPGSTGSGPGSSGSGPGVTSSGVGPSGSSGSGGMICPSFGDPCTDCMSQVCPAVYCGCYENQECLDLFSCSGTCNGDDACEQACLTAHEAGISDALLLSDCAGGACDPSCFWGDEVDPCTECILTECDAAMNACLAEPECLALYGCLGGCGQVDLACQQGCYDDHGAGVPSLQTVLECSQDQCVDAC